MDRDSFGLDRFLEAQARGETYERALLELRGGRKSTHWMWFVFPQIAGLGRSAMAERYAIASIEEARAFLDHPVLGARLRECVATLNDLGTSSAVDIFGSIDAMKLRSSLTLFVEASPEESSFSVCLDRFFRGAADDATKTLLHRG